MNNTHNTILKIFASAEMIKLSGNKPYRVEEAAIYFIEKGEADIFYIREEGDLLSLWSFGEFDVFTLPAGIQISGRDGSAIKKLLLSEVNLYVEDKTELTLLLNKIISFMDHAFLDWYTLSPEGDSFSGEAIDLPADHILIGNNSNLLVETTAKACLCDVYTIDRITTLFLTKNNWLRAIEDICVRPLEINNDNFIRALRELHCILGEYFNQKNAHEHAVWFERIEAQRQNDSSTFETTLKELVGVLEHQDVGIIDGNELTIVCSMVLKECGIKIDPNKIKNITDVETFTKQAGLRCRKVSLTGDWYNSDCGVLIGRLEERPVILKPDGDQYLYSFAGSEYRKLKADVAKKIDSFGWSIFNALPNEKVTGKDILHLSFNGGVSDLFWVILIGVFVGILGMATPAATGYIIGEVIPGGKYNMLFEFGCALAVATIASSLFALVQGFAMMRFTARSSFKLQTAIWDRILSLPASFFGKYDSGDLSSRAMGIIGIKDIMADNILSTVLSVAVGGFNIIVAMLYSWRLALIAIGFAIFGSLVGLVLSLFQLKFQRKTQKIAGEIQGLVLQLITGISKIRVAGAEVRAFSRWSRLFARQRTYNFDYAIFSKLFNMLFSLLPLMQTGLIFYIVVAMDEKDKLSTGSYMAFTAAAAQISSAISSISGTVISVIQALPQYERAKPILYQKTEQNDSAIEAPELKGNIELRGVDFSYDEKTKILKSIDFKVNKGEFVAIVGSSGAGKSTMLQVLLGLEKVNAGIILFDDVDIATYNTTSLRKQFGVVLQGGGVMQGSIFENICGAQHLTHQQVWDALEHAGLAKEVREMPMGIHTVLPHGGGVLSGGQLQRLMIARALGANPRILFFDEATSALDNNLQAEVSENIEKLNLTRIVVAHRLSTIRNADKIYVLDKGSVAQVGTFDDLRDDSNGIFAQLCKRQELNKDKNIDV